MRSTAAVSLLLFALCLLAAGAADAQPPDPLKALLDDIRAHKDKKQLLVSSWEWKAQMALGVTIAIGILGVIAAALQAPSQMASKRFAAGAKITAATAGLAIGVLTVINNQVFPADHRTLSRYALAGVELLERLDRHLAALAGSDATTRARLVADIYGLLDEVNKLAKRLAGENAPVTGEPRAWMAVAHAGAPPGVLPDWKDRLPSKESPDAFFVGEAVDKDLYAAKYLSEQAARAKALRHLFGDRRPDEPQERDFRALFTKLAEVVDWAYVADRDGYRARSMLRVSGYLYSLVARGLFTASPASQAPVKGGVRSQLLTTGDHHCARDCRGEPTRTGYRIVLDAPSGSRLANPALRCVSGPCAFSQVLSVQLENGGARARAAFDVWSRPTTWQLQADVISRP